MRFWLKHGIVGTIALLNLSAPTEAGRNHRPKCWLRISCESLRQVEEIKCINNCNVCISNLPLPLCGNIGGTDDNCASASDSGRNCPILQKHLPNASFSTTPSIELGSNIQSSANIVIRSGQVELPYTRTIQRQVSKLVPRLYAKTEETVYFATNREMTHKEPQLVFGNERRHGVPYYGTVAVEVPIREEVGLLDGVRIGTIRLLNENDFFNQLGGLSPDKQALVFIHGFNVTFEDAARRTAQLKVDTKFEGPAIFFSWPSQGSYLADEEVCELSRGQLKAFLRDITRRLAVTRIHVIAHSMGANAFGEAIAELGREQGFEATLFDQVILAAADIDSEVFTERILPHFAKCANRVTMYATPNDEALRLSRMIRRDRNRIGGDVDRLINLTGVDGIDTSSADCVYWWKIFEEFCHDYYGDSPPVIKDVEAVLAGKSPEERMRLGYLKRTKDRFEVPSLRP